ncbi:MAG TPA: integrase core domain-containing protein, partial [Leptospiraceae bacterium]|nr:integrase core domain-containing protein [Leptospiraceae bacterium]
PPSRHPGPGWKEFFSIHREGVAAMDFFTVPSWNFVPYYVFFIIDHSRRSILWVNVTTSPSLDWLKNQFRSAFPDNVPRILISDNDSVFRSAKNWVREVMGIRSHFTRIMSPWQNGVAERWVRTVRRELTDHVIPLSEQHLRTLLLEYVKHYNEDRTHTTLGLDSPTGREVHVRGSPSNVIRLPKVRGLSSRYVYSSAA